MMPFLIFGVVVTLLIVVGGAVAWILLNRRADPGSVKSRLREHARQLQEHFEGDADFARNFHRPTQNECLETIQALDHLEPDWETGNPELVVLRLKNELAESFPALRKASCDYPVLIEEDVAKLAGKKKLSPEALETLRLQHAEQIANARTQFHAARAQANARHQMTSGPEVGPAQVVAGSLPFRLSDEAADRPRRSAWVPRLAVLGVVMIGLAGTALYGARNPVFRESLKRLVHGGGGSSGQPPTPSPVLVPGAPTPAPPTAPDSAENVRNPGDGSAPGAASPGVAATTPDANTLPAAVAPPPPGTPTPPSLAQLVAISKARAAAKYPDLLEPDTEINTRFVFRYKKLFAEQSPRLQDPNWPEKLADECAAAAAPKPRKTSQGKR